MPDGYRMPPHSHPGDEFVEVKEGTLLVGIGDVLDPAHTMRVEVGDTGVHAHQAPRRPSFPFGY